MSVGSRQAVGAAGSLAVGAAGSLAIAAAVNVTTGMLTDRWGLAWLAATVALVAVGSGLVWWERRDTSGGGVSASGDGAVAGGGNVRDVVTRVERGPAGPGERAEPGPGVSASGLGSVAGGADVEGVRTEVTGESAQEP